MVFAELVVQWQGSAAPERSRYTAVHGYPHVPRETRTGLFSLIILYIYIYKIIKQKKDWFENDISCLKYEKC